jgi:Tripartite tricarboxylate transporter family receptor
MNRRDLLALGLASLSATALAPRTAPAQGKYPERPIKLMVAFSAGGVNDVVARQWAERVKTVLGTVYVENQGGGSGTIATGEAARAQPDGYTIALGSTSTMVLNPMTMAKVPYDAAKDFVPIAIIAVSTTSIVVHQSVPVKTLPRIASSDRPVDLGCDAGRRFSKAGMDIFVEDRMEIEIRRQVLPHRRVGSAEREHDRVRPFTDDAARLEPAVEADFALDERIDGLKAQCLLDCLDRPVVFVGKLRGPHQ